MSWATYQTEHDKPTDLHSRMVWHKYWGSAHGLCRTYVRKIHAKIIKRSKALRSLRKTLNVPWRSGNWLWTTETYGSMNQDSAIRLQELAVFDLRTDFCLKCCLCTPDLLNKKHQNFGQGLEFLNFSQGNRGLNQQNRRKTQENLRNNEENQRKFVKTFRDQDPYFLFKIFLFNIVGVVRVCMKTMLFV